MIFQFGLSFRRPQTVLIAKGFLIPPKKAIFTPWKTISPLLKMQALEEQNKFSTRLNNIPQDTPTPFPRSQAPQCPGALTQPWKWETEEAAPWRGPGTTWLQMSCEILPKIPPNLKSDYEHSKTASEPAT